MEFVLIICVFLIFTCAMFPRIELFSSLPFNVHVTNPKSVKVIAADIEPMFSKEVSYYERTNEEFQLIMNDLVEKTPNEKDEKMFVRHNAKLLDLKHIDTMKRKILTQTSLGEEGYVVVYVNVKDLLKSRDDETIVKGVFCVYKQGKIVGKEVSFEIMIDNDEVIFRRLKVNGNVNEDNIILKPYDTLNHSFGSSSLSSSLIELSMS